MQININVLSVNKSTGTSKSGKPYQFVEVSYKDMEKGKVAGKKIMSFDPVFPRAAGMQNGETYEITLAKEGDYWNWTKIVQAAPGSVPETTGGVSKPVATTVKSTYETPEERAKKQVYIVKQSSLSAAVDILKHNNPKASVEVASVLALAQTLVDFVFDVQPKAEIASPSLTELDDDIPY